MGFWSSIKDAFSGKDDATRIQELAAELSRYADRYENAGDAENAALARDYAERVASARSLKEAKALYSEFKAVTSKYHDEGYHERQHHAIDDGRDSCLARGGKKTDCSSFYLHEQDMRRLKDLGESNQFLQLLINRSQRFLNNPSNIH